MLLHTNFNIKLKKIDFILLYELSFKILKYNKINKLKNKLID